MLGPSHLHGDLSTGLLRRAVISASFLFWQQQHDSLPGAQYVTLYNPSRLPHIGIIDPRTGQLCKELCGFMSSERLLDVLVSYADKDLQPIPSVTNTVPAPAPGAPGWVQAATERFRESYAEKGPEHADPAPTREELDAYWAAYSLGTEPAAGEGLQVAIKLPDGTRYVAPAQRSPAGALDSHAKPFWPGRLPTQGHEAVQRERHARRRARPHPRQL